VPGEAVALQEAAMSLDAYIDALTHEHVFLGSSHDQNARRTLWVVLLTAAMMIAEIVAGLAFHSMALLADGFHMATHAGALGVAALAYVYARRYARSRRYAFGTGKVGDLAGFASALILGVVAIGIAVESISRLTHPVAIAFGEATLIAIVGLLVNIASVFLLSGGHHHQRVHEEGHRHRHDHDNNFRSAYLHVIADALTSVLAIGALIAGRYLGWAWLDPFAGIIGAIVIASWSWTLMRDTSAVLLDMADQQLETEVLGLIEGPGDARITDLHLWRVGPESHAAIVSVIGLDRAVVRERLSSVHEIAHLTIESHELTGATRHGSL
jgi:cation diffusion facilitator family transporter